MNSGWLGFSLSSSSSAAPGYGGGGEGGGSGGGGDGSCSSPVAAAAAVGDSPVVAMHSLHPAGSVQYDGPGKQTHAYLEG